MSLILASLVSYLAIAGDLHLPAPTAETRPWGICHWFGNAVEPAELEKETARWADAGMGGYRIIPIYGAKGYEDKYVKFMSPAFLDTLVAAKKIAADKDMKVDMSFGAGWCFGGTTVPKELGVWALISLNDGDREPKNGKTLWEGEGRRLVAYPTGQAVKRAQDLDAGPMLNPYSPVALDAHLKLFKTLEGRPDAFPRATFHDSFEYFKAGWSDELPALFKKYRGYALEDHFAELAGVGDPETVARVKCDYRETLSDIIVKETFPKWTAWCRERGIITHNQAHGAPANLLEFYAIADTPETEMFGRGKRDRFASGFDERFREGDRSILMSKFASSAAHLTGKRFTSAESFTWMGEHFCETLEEMKAFGDLLFLAGVNRLYYHAMVYSPDSAPWPGWCFYAASQLNPRNPLWRDMKPLNEYFTRVQTMTAAATPDNDVLLFWPIYDQWMQADGFAQLYSVHARWFDELPFGKLAERLTAAGYQFDYTSDTLLTEEIVSRYKAIIVPETKYMKPVTLARLAELAKRMPVIFEKELPASAPGLNGKTLARPDGLAPVADALDALAKTAAEPVSFATVTTGLDAVRYRWKDKTLYFIVNSSMKTVGLEVSDDAVVFDPMPDGRIGALWSDAPEVDRVLTLAPAESVFVYGGITTYPKSPHPQKNTDALANGRVVNLGPWALEFVRDVSSWELPMKR
ncbi:MAG: glycosyl hydrolase, partial [Kiritimatiellae bacterium]|nr:glycosyl hydrolase [Kiritimatiellia bacterium]